MSRDPGTTEKTAVVGGNQVSTESVMTGTCAAGRGRPKVPGSARHCRIGGNLVPTSADRSTPQPWKPGFHGARRSHLVALDAGTIWRVDGNQVSTALATTARRPYVGGNLKRGIGHLARRVPAGGEGLRALRTSPSATHRGKGGNQVSTVARVSTPRAWKPGFHGAWRAPFVRLDTGARPAGRNVDGNQVSIPLEIQHG